MPPSDFAFANDIRAAAALRTPRTSRMLLVTFLALAGISALINAVPPVVAFLGLAVTVDAIALFFLAPLAGVDLTRGSRIVWFFAIVIGVASLIAVLQALLGTTILGLSTTAGRSGEGVRIGSLVGDPNAFGVLIGMVLTMPIAAAAFSIGRRRLLAAAFALVLAVALLFTYSRGAWFGTLIGIVAASLLTRQLRLLPYAAGIGLVYKKPAGEPAVPSVICSAWKID